MGPTGASNGLAESVYGGLADRESENRVTDSGLWIHHFDFRKVSWVLAPLGIERLDGRYEGRSACER